MSTVEVAAVQLQTATPTGATPSWERSMKSDEEVTKTENAFLRAKAELHLLGRLLRETVTLKLPWQYYAIGALLWADGLLAGWLICSDLF